MSKYHKDITHLKTLDPYRLQELYQMHPCAEHVVKKLLVAGERSGGKSLDTDIADCIWTLQRWQEMRAEDAVTVSPGIDATSDADREAVFTSRYEWAQAPEWAKYAATDKDGRFFWYEQKPKALVSDGVWSPNGGNACIGAFDVFPTGDDWTHTLEARPK